MKILDLDSFSENGSNKVVQKIMPIVANKKKPIEFASLAPN